ncbi:unnamed protein product [Allacma fusca]|uniref:Uncharacterized protein n=1 Tax=Allacma fusca TaxID=39272 RepID=A0A8J2JTD9_9HEXA|nr:unnamed protein product [Allacma fusca]
MPKDATEGSLERTNAIIVNKTPGSELNQVYTHYFPRISKDPRSEETTSQALRHQNFKQRREQQIPKPVTVPQKVPQPKIVTQPEDFSTSHFDSNSSAQHTSNQNTPTILSPVPRASPFEVPKTIPYQTAPEIPKSIPNRMFPEVPKSMPTQMSSEKPDLQSKVRVYKPTTIIFNNGALQKEKVMEVTPQPSQKFEYKTPSAFATIQPYGERGTTKPVATSSGCVPIFSLDRNIPTEQQIVSATLEKMKTSQVPKVSSSTEKKRLSTEGNVSPTSAGSTPSPPRKSSLTTMYNLNLDPISKPTEAVKIKTPKPAVNLTTASNASTNYKPDDKRHPIPEVKDETTRPAGPVQPAVKVITKIVPTNIPSKTVNPTRQTRTSSSTSIDSPKQPSGYTYTYNFRDPTTKSDRSPLSPQISTNSRFPLSSKRSDSSSSDDTDMGKQSPSSSYSRKIPTSVKSRGSPTDANSSANSASTSSPAQPLTIGKFGPESKELLKELF